MDWIALSALVLSIINSVVGGGWVLYVHLRNKPKLKVSIMNVISTTLGSTNEADTRRVKVELRNTGRLTTSVSRVYVIESGQTIIIKQNMLEKGELPCAILPGTEATPLITKPLPNMDISADTVYGVEDIHGKVILAEEKDRVRAKGLGLRRFSRRRRLSKLRKVEKKQQKK